MVLTALQKLALNMALRLLAFVGAYAQGLIRSFIQHAKAERADDPSLGAVIKLAVQRANERRAADPSISWSVLFVGASDQVMVWAENAGREYSRAMINALLDTEVLSTRDPLPPDSTRTMGSTP